MEMSDIKKTRSGEEKAPLGVMLAADSRKTTLLPGGGEGISSVNDIIRKHEALAVKCVFSNGRCMKHFVKLEKTVKKKEYNVVSNAYSVGWKYHDMTCLVYPSQGRRGSVIMESVDNSLSKAMGKKRNLKSENSGLFRD